MLHLEEEHDSLQAHFCHAFDKNWDVLPWSYRDNVWFTLDPECVPLSGINAPNVLGNLRTGTVDAQEVVSETADSIIQDNVTCSLPQAMRSQINTN